MDRTRAALLELLTAHADNGWMCPTVKQFAAALDAGMSTVAKHMEDLRKDGVISWRLIKLPPNRQVRIVTIAATGKSTAEPKLGKKIVDTRPAFAPTEHGSHVRILSGREFEKRKRELEARDAEERRKREAVG